MKKVVIRRAGGYERLEIKDLPSLGLEPKQVRVQIHAIGINYADCLVRWGVYESAKQLVGWPITPGFEFSGVVTEVGKEVQDYKLGQKVYGVNFFNCYADEICVPDHQLFALPEGADLVDYAGFPVIYMTAYHALFQLVRLYPKSRILVHSAAGGVGSALVILAKIKGFHVTGVVGSSSKVDYLRSLGADDIIDKSREDLWSRVRQLSPVGFDAVFDANGYSTYGDSYRHLKPTGKLVCYGSHQLLPKGAKSGRMDYLRAAIGLLKTPRFNPLDLITDNKTVVGFNLSFLFGRTDLFDETRKDFADWIEQGKIAPVKTTRIPFAEVAKAHQLIESGQSQGKIVLVTEFAR